MDNSVLILSNMYGIIYGNVKGGNIKYETCGSRLSTLNFSFLLLTAFQIRALFNIIHLLTYVEVDMECY